jgi:hypothetical protein
MWLSIPVVGTVLAAIASWLRSRPRRAPTTSQAMQAHDDYLAALARPPAHSGDGDSVAGPTSD